MKQKEYEIVGIIPAAGNATRLSPIPCSKEIFPVSFSEDRSQGEAKIEVAVSHLLESYSLADANQIYMIIQKGKWIFPNILALERIRDTLWLIL